MEKQISITMLAQEAMGSKGALKWLETPHEALEGKRPLDVWDDPEAAQIIERILLRMKGLPLRRTHGNA